MMTLAMAATAEHLETDLDTAPAVDDVRLDWLPSLPITRKRQVPPIACIAFFYSETSGKIFHLFETTQLRESLTRYSRQQAAALGQDPDSRVGWLELPSGHGRSRLLGQLIERYKA